MPSRFLKDSICRSEEIDALSWFEEVLFYRLITACDDFGRFDARIKIIKGQCFPLKSVSEKQIEDGLSKLSSVGLVRVYESRGRSTLQIVTWDKYQNRRAKDSKYPAFDGTCKQLYVDGFQENENTFQQMITNDNKCMQVLADDSKCPRTRTRTRNSYSKLDNSNICSELSRDSDPDDATFDQSVVDESQEQIEPFITLQLNTGEEYPFFPDDVAEWQSLYPAVDVAQELRNMKGWCLNNKQKRKTKAGIRRFVNAWLAREQDKGGSTRPGNRAPQSSAMEQWAENVRGWNE